MFPFTDMNITGSIPLPTLSEFFYCCCCLLLLPCFCFTVPFIAEILAHFIIDRVPLRVGGVVLIH